MNERKVCLLGATGETGKMVLNRLLTKGCEVTVLTRRDWPDENPPAALKIVKGSLFNKVDV